MFAVRNEIAVFVVIPGEAFRRILNVSEYVAGQKIVVCSGTRTYRIFARSDIYDTAVDVNIRISAFVRRSILPFHPVSAGIIISVADDYRGKLITVSEVIVIIFYYFRGITFIFILFGQIFFTADSDEISVLIADDETVDCGKICYTFHRNEFKIGTTVECKPSERRRYFFAVFVYIVILAANVLKLGYACGNNDLSYDIVTRKRAYAEIFNGMIAVFAVVILGENVNLFRIEARVRSADIIALVCLIVNVQNLFGYDFAANFARAVFNTMRSENSVLLVFLSAIRASVFYFSRRNAGVCFDYGFLVVMRESRSFGKRVEKIEIVFCNRSYGKNNNFAVLQTVCICVNVESSSVNVCPLAAVYRDLITARVFNRAPFKRCAIFNRRFCGIKHFRAVAYNFYGYFRS